MSISALPGRRVTAAAIAAVALIGGAVAIAPHLAKSGKIRIQQVDAVGGAAYNGTVNDGGSQANVPGQNMDAPVYGYPGSPTPVDTNLTQYGGLPDGTEVHIQCYLIGQPVAGPNGLASGGTDGYWDVIDSASNVLPSMPGVDTAVVPDAYINTSPTVDNLVPSCISNPGGNQGTPQNQGNASNTALNGTASVPVTVYVYSGTGNLNENLPSSGTILYPGDQVHIVCYLVGDPTSGPDGTGSGATDLYWDRIDSVYPGPLPSVGDGNIAVVPDASIQTSPSVDQLVPAC